ncbi:MAG: 23S rRNA (uracil(1939)-C(5))-methyltransferase RlmD, partial [Xanthomonadales bacterium]|nr:23S rRNA (uracil(1939)-C(5))-methyltransferase RlmD [Xanthomonadales bacterium]
AQALDAHRRIPQIEVACGDQVASLVVRHLDPLGDSDQSRLATFAQQTGIAIFLQPGGINSIQALEPDDITLSYALPMHDVTIRFQPADFVQVNAEINRKMVDRVLDLMALTRNDRVLDLFCGLGNFTLPMARYAGEVVGVEGDAGLVERAMENAAGNDVENARYHRADLKQAPGEAAWLAQPYDKVLVDPPRSGAEEMLPHISATGARRLVYVACNPVSLARDAAILKNDFGFSLEGAGIIDMFPHTDHVESVAILERSG